MQGASRGGHDLAGGGTGVAAGRRRVWALLVPLVAAVILFDVGSALPASAAPGDLDPTFDGDGIATTAITSSVSVVDQAVQVAPGLGERLLVLTAGGDVWRFLPDGTLDIAFDDDGVLPLADRFPSLDLDHLATHPDGRFVIVGDVDVEPPPSPNLGMVGVARFLPDGATDEGFGTGGLALESGFVPPGDPDDCARTLTSVADVGVRTTGDTVVVLAAMNAPSGEFCVGSQAASLLIQFAEGGNVLSRTETTNHDEWSPREVVVTDLWTVVSAATRADFGSSDPAIGAARYLPDGSPDASFGGSPDGVVQFEHEGLATPLPLVVQDDGTAGVAYEGFDDQWLLLRWDAVGEPLEGDPQAADLPDEAWANEVADLAPSNDGGWVVVGEMGLTDAPIAGGIAVFEPTGPAAGGVDTVVRPDPPETGVSLESLVALADGSLRVAGELFPELEGVAPRLLNLSQLDTSGAFDASFGPDGTGFASHHGNGIDLGLAIAVDPERQPVAAGLVFNNGLDDSSPLTGFILRHKEAGPLDPTFAPDPIAGIEMARYPQVEGTVDAALAGLALDAEVRPIVAGWTQDFSDDPGVIQRRGPDGGDDVAFNTGLPRVASIGDDSTVLLDVVVDPDGRIVAVGQATSPDPDITEIVVVRVLPDGTLDPGFGSGGVVRIGPDPETVDGWTSSGRGVAIDDEGRVVVTGMSQDTPDGLTTHLLVARLLDDGSRDTTFAGHAALGDGVWLEVARSGHAGNDVVTDGTTILVAGTFNEAPGFGSLAEPQAFVARLRPDAFLDADFGTDGFSDPFQGGDQSFDTAQGIALDAVGTILVAGGSLEPGESAEDPPVAADLMLARIGPDGTPDPLFGTAGQVTTDLGLAAAEQGRDLAVAPDGKIVVVGDVTDDRGSRVLVARYEPGAGVLECTPDPTDVGAVELGDTAAAVVTCTAADGRVVIDKVGIDPASTDPADFTIGVEDCTGAALAPGESCTIDLTFAPAAVGPRSAALDVTHRTAVASDLTETVQLVGEGTGDPDFQATPNPVVFAERLLSTTSPAQVVTGTNIGIVDLDVTALTIVGSRAADFDIAATTCVAATLAPAGSCTVDVTFTPLPATTLDRAARLRFATTAPGTPHFVELKGTVTPPDLVLDPVEGPIETEVEATGSGYESGTPVTLKIAGIDVGTVAGSAVTGGGFVTTFDVPPSTPGGDQEVVACQRCATTISTTASATFTVTPRLFVDPPIGPPGFVTGVEGDGFPPGPVLLRWSLGIGVIEVDADAAGELDTHMLVFHRDQLGERELHARLGGESEPAATAPFLVVPGRGVPNDFAIRR